MKPPAFAMRAGAVTSFALLTAGVACAKAHPESTAHPPDSRDSPVPVPLPLPVPDPASGPRATPPADAASPDASAPGPTAADVAKALGEARTAIRPDAPSSAASSVESNLFVLVAPHPGPFFTAAVKLAHDALAAYLHDRFTRVPAQPIKVYLFPEHASYEAFCRKRFAGTPTATKHCTGPTLGFYHRDSRELLANLGSGTTTLSHEMVHPLLETDFPRAPEWLSEGIASLYEAPVFPKPEEIKGATDWRARFLRPVFLDPRRRPATRLRVLFPMTDQAFHADEDLSYALARFVCQWLDEQGKLWSFYHAWRDAYADDPIGERAFRIATARTPEEAEADWERWLQARLGAEASP